MTSIRLISLLARRFMRDRAQAQAALVAFVAAAFLITMVITLAAFSPSGEQAVERDLGRFGHQMPVGNLGQLKPGDDRLVTGIVAAGRAAGAPDLTAKIFSSGLRVTGTQTPLTYEEMDWAAEPFPRRYVLRDGRWPARPGEAVVTNAGVVGAAPGGVVSALSDRVRFQVVGVADDRFYGDATVLAAPGTWNTFDDDLNEAFTTLGAAVNVYWGTAPPEPVIAAIGEVAARHYRMDVKAAVNELTGVTTTVEGVIASQESRSTWVGRAPAAYEAPSYILPVLAVLLVFGLNDRRLRRSTAILSSVGVPPRIAVAGVAVSSAVWTLLATLAGTAAGVGLGAAARQIVAPLIDTPLPPLRGLGEPILRLFTLTMIGCMAAALLLVTTGKRRAARPAQPATARRRKEPGVWGRRLRTARHIAAMLFIAAAIWQVSGMDVPRKGMVFAATLSVAVLLIVPDLVRYTLSRLPDNGPRSRLAGRQLAADHRRAVIAVAVLATALGGPLGFLTLFNTMIVSVQASTMPATGPGQVAAGGNGEFLQPPSRPTLDTVRAALPGRTEVQLWSLSSPDTGAVQPRGTGAGYFWAADTLEDVAALAGKPLTPEQTRTLHTGGILGWDDPLPAEYVLVADEGLPTARQTPPIPTRALTLPEAEWHRNAYDIMLTGTARQLKLPVSAGAVFFTGVSAAESATVRPAVQTAGLNTRDVLLDEQPPPPVPPVALYASALGLFLLILLIALAVARGQVKALRTYLGTLIAVGVPTRWARHVLLYQQAVTVALSTLLAALIAIPPVIVIAWRLPGYVLDIPWTWLALSTAAFYAATIAMTLITGRRLRASDRTVYS